MTDLDRPVRAGTLRSQVVEILRNAIFYGKLQPGAVLRELPLARKLEVSQSTVREALAELEQYGLVVRQGARGTMVAMLSAEEIQGRMKVRLALEELAFAEACAVLTGEDFDSLEHMAAAIASSIAKGAYFEAAEADFAFHRKVWEKSRNPILLRTLEQVTFPLFAFLNVVLKMARTQEYHTQPHEHLVEGLRTRDPERARQAIRHHMGLSPILALQPLPVAPGALAIFEASR